jgi:hypothetical protein
MPSGWVPLDLLTRKIKLRCIKSIVLGHYLFEMARIWIQIGIKQLDPDLYKIEKQDQDPDQIEKPDSYQKGLGPQHCFHLFVRPEAAAHIGRSSFGGEGN